MDQPAFRSATAQRRVRILEELELKGQVTVPDLSTMFKKSETTIRNDLARLEERRKLVRARGGAIRIRGNRITGNFQAAAFDDIEPLKQRQLSLEALKLIKENETIILDAGTITTEIAKNLGQFKNLTIVTNALNIASILSLHEGCNIFIPGGALCKNSLSFAGSTTGDNLERFYCDKLFLCSEDLDSSDGLSSPSSERAHLIQTMMKISRKVILLADSAKLGCRSTFYVSSISNLDIIITDAGIKQEDKNKLEARGVRVIVADSF